MLEANCDRKMCQNKNRRDVVQDQKLEEIVEMRLTVVLRRRPKMFRSGSRPGKDIFYISSHDENWTRTFSFS